MRDTKRSGPRQLPMSVRRRTLVLGAAGLVLTLLFIVTLLVAGRVRLAELVGAECVLDGKMLSTLPRGIDVAVTPEALTAVESSGDDLHPEVLLQSGVAQQVLFEGRLYSLNGPYLASRPSEAQKLPSGWLISVGGSRKVSWRKTATRVTVTDSGGHEVGFVEYRRGCIGKPGKPLGITQALGIRLDGPSLPDEVDPLHPRRSVAVTWQSLRKQDSGSVAKPSSSGCPASFYYHVYASTRIRFKHSELHPTVRPFLVCKGNMLYVLQHEAVPPFSERYFLVLNRFDIRREAWLDATRFEAPLGLLSDVSSEPDSTAIQITLGSRRFGEQQTARLEIAALD